MVSYELPIVINDYCLYEKISKGAFGTVFKAKSLKYGLDFALKVVPISNKNGQRTYEAEVNALMNLDHPGIVKIYQNFVYNDNFFIVYELCVCSLKDEIVNNNPPMNQRYSLLKQIALSLSYCHSKNICHRDIKPANFLIDQNGNVKVGDFGFSMMFSDETKQELDKLEENDDNKKEPAAVLSMDHKIEMFEGSPAYCSPEIIMKKAFNPFMSDVWSFGVMVFFMFTGEIPWKFNTFAEMKSAIISRSIYMEPSIPKDISILIFKCLKTNPKERLTMANVVKYLSDIRVRRHSNIYRLPNGSNSCDNITLPKALLPINESESMRSSFLNNEKLIMFKSFLNIHQHTKRKMISWITGGGSSDESKGNEAQASPTTLCIHPTEQNINRLIVKPLLKNTMNNEFV